MVRLHVWPGYIPTFFKTMICATLKTKWNQSWNQFAHTGSTFPTYQYPLQRIFVTKIYFEEKKNPCMHQK